MTFTATVKTDVGGPVSKGTVEFSIGGNSFGPETLDNHGNASFDDSALNSGTYPVSATYSGTDAFGSSTGTESGGQTVDEAPAITSTASATFTTGSAGSFDVTAAGFPTPTLSESSGTSLASLGLGFNASNGVLSGTPAPGTGGTYGLKFIASNGVGSSAIQNFSLSIKQAPKITSVDNATFIGGVPNSFNVTATGAPTPALSESGTLPDGVTFDPDTGLLSGTPATTDPGGVYTESFTASNGVGSNDTQTFFLVVDQPPAITSANNVTFEGGSPGSFTVTATGAPTPVVSETGTLPDGVTFDPSTGILGGTPAATDPGGVYTITFTASNGLSPDFRQTFALVIDQPPAITSADTTTFSDSVDGSFTVTATGSPPPQLSESGTLPSGVGFDADTGLLSGTPAAGTDGFYSLTFTASNGVGTDATQNFGFWVVPPSQLLTAPTRFVVTGVTPTSIAFDWTDNDPSATGYEVQEAVAGSTNFVPLPGSPLGPGTNSASAAGLVSGTSYQFEVRAVNTAGVSAWLVSGAIETLLTTAASLSADPNPLVLTQTAANSVDTGNDITFTATVSNTSGTGGLPAGQVDFQDTTTGTDLGTVPLSNGSASLNVPSFDIGNDTIVAAYEPDPASLFAGSQNSVTEEVEADTATTVTMTPSPGILGQSVSFTATVENQFNEGRDTDWSVQFLVDGAAFGAAILLDQNGQATLNDASLPAGNHDISALYLPDGSFAPSQGDASVDVDLGDAWTGGAGDGNWDDPGNWTDGVPQANEDVSLSGLAPGTVINLGPADVANNVTIVVDATMSGGQLTVGGMLNDSATLTLAEDAKLIALHSMLQNVDVMPGASCRSRAWFRATWSTTGCST